MTTYVQINTDFSFRADFKVNGEFVAADVGSVTMTMTRNDGSVVTGYSSKPISTVAGATGVNIVIPAADNMNLVPNEVRYVRLNYTSNGLPYVFKSYYMLRDNTDFPLTPDEVRALLGVDEVSLPDSSIDILGAYQAVRADIAPVDADAILSGGTDLLPTLILAVKLRAAMFNISNIQTAMFQSEQADNNSYKRFANIDFANIFNDLMSQYQGAISLLTGVDIGTANGTLLVLTTETDAITGQ